ncbi:MAG: FKBP-type peptidyl-prolyl cis-trans isomerase [Bacteroidales bacterium]|nr:FKBP-type peptidyl-prolyl cis-trans isomerase [Bacteroidales bacterium]
MVVALSYQLEVEGKIADSAPADAPLEYIHGAGMLLPRFEEEVAGTEAGQTFDFILSAEEGYGTYHPEYKIDIPLAAFEVDGQVRSELLAVGRTLPMLNTAGQVVQGTVAAIKADAVTMDFNHPMAGKTLHFTGKVERLREATEKELTEGLHGEFLPQEGCCGCHGEEEGACCGHGKGEGACCHGEEKSEEGCCHGGHGKGHCKKQGQ